MNDDYLWDKTGEPDPQIQQLEEILGTLGHEPRPLALPATRRRRYIPILAIAATVLLALLATGLWLRVRTSSQPAHKEQAYVPAPPTIVEHKTAKEPEKVVPPVRERRLRGNRRSQSAASAFKKREREEALAVKQQLMLALRVASEKLNLAQKKSQIKNQHRIG